MGKNSKLRRDAKKKNKTIKNKSSVKSSAISSDFQSFMAKTRSDYINAWSVSSLHFEENGHYDWMADQVKGFNKILEVGTGDGRSTKALLSNGHKVISIDENPKCLDLAEKNLRESGFSVLRLDREMVVQGEFSYDINYPPIHIADNNIDVILINADISNDPHLESFLQHESIDAVICWLIGTNGARRFNRSVQSHGDPKTPSDYRILTQNRVYEVADKILSQGKILSIIDRGVQLTTEYKDLFFQLHLEQASVTSLEVLVDSICDREYSEPQDDNAMEMDFRNQGTGEQITGHQSYFNSIISRKK